MNYQTNLYSYCFPSSTRSHANILSYVYKYETDTSYVYNCIEKPIFNILVDKENYKFQTVLYNLTDEQQERAENYASDLYNGQAEWKFLCGEQEPYEDYYVQACEEMFGVLEFSEIVTEMSYARSSFSVRYENTIDKEIKEYEGIIQKAENTFKLAHEETQKISNKFMQKHDVKIGDVLYQIYYGKPYEFIVTGITGDEVKYITAEILWDGFSKGTYILHLVQVESLPHFTISHVVRKEDGKVFGSSVFEQSNTVQHSFHKTYICSDLSLLWYIYYEDQINHATSKRNDAKRKIEMLLAVKAATELNW